MVALLAARDLQSNLGSNLALVKKLTVLDPLVAPRASCVLPLRLPIGGRCRS